MKGDYNAPNVPAAIALAILFFGVIPCCCLFAESDAAIITIAAVPMMIGVVPVMTAMRRSGSYEADDKGLTIRLGNDEQRFGYNDIEDIGCEYTEKDRVVSAKLTILRKSGERFSISESCSENLAELLNDPTGAKKPRLMVLCDYVKQEMGR